jgi:hypothetical protein
MEGSVSGVAHGAFSRTKSNQTAVLFNAWASVESSCWKTGARLLIFEAERLVMNVELPDPGQHTAYRIVRPADVNGDGVTELLLELCMAWTGQVQSSSMIISLNNGRKRTLKEWPDTLSRPMANLDPDDRPQASVIWVRPGPTPKYSLRKFLGRCIERDDENTCPEELIQWEPAP